VLCLTVTHKLNNQTFFFSLITYTSLTNSIIKLSSSALLTPIQLITPKYKMQSLSFRDQVLRSASCVDRPVNSLIRSTQKNHHSVPGLRLQSRRDIRHIPGVVIKDEIGDFHLLSDLLNISQESLNSSLPQPRRTFKDYKKEVSACNGNFRNAVMKSPLVQNEVGKEQPSENKLSLRSQIVMSKPSRRKQAGNNKLVLRSFRAQASKPKDSSSTESISSTASFAGRRKRDRSIRMPSLTESDESEDEA